MGKNTLILGPYPPPYNGLSLFTKEHAEHDNAFLLGTSLKPLEAKDKVVIKKRFFPLILPRLLLEIRSRKQDVEKIEAHFATTFGYLAYLAKKFWGIEYRVYAHGSDVLINLNKPLLRFMTLRALKNSSEVVAVSNKIKEVLVEEGIDSGKIRVEYEKIDRKKFRKLKLKKLNQIIFVGSVHPVKGVDILLRAFSEVNRRFPKYKLAIVGRIADKSYYRELLRICRENNLEDTVEFLGERTDIPELLNKSKLFVLPSRSEGYGRVLLEAVACGLPVVAANVGGIPEVVQNRKDVLLVEPDSPEKLAKAIEKVLIKVE